MLGNSSRLNCVSIAHKHYVIFYFSIQEAVSRLQEQWYTASVSEAKAKTDFGLDNLNIGPPIAKGCAAVVYAAALKTDTDMELAIPPMSPESTAAAEPNIRHEMMSPIQNTSRFLHNFGGSVDNLHFSRPERSRFDSINEDGTEMTGGGKTVRFNTAMNVLHHQSVSQQCVE